MDRIAIQEKLLSFVKKYRYVLLVLLVGMFLMCLPEGEDEAEVNVQEETQSEEADLEQRLEEILAQIDGAGKVKVLLTEQSGSSVVYQTDTDRSTGTDSTSEQLDTVIVTDTNRTEQGLIRQINPPVYLGAVIVCQGGDRPSVQLAIVEAVSNATGLGADQITVLKMK